MTTVEIYQSISPEIGSELLKEELLPKLLSICENLYQVYTPHKNYVLSDLQERFIQLNKVVSLEKQIVLTLDKEQLLDWKSLMIKLVEMYPQFVWIQIREDVSPLNIYSYYFNFVPIAIKEADFPFTISLNESLKQQLSPLSIDVIKEFKTEFELLIEEFTYSNNGQDIEKNNKNEPIFKKRKKKEVSERNHEGSSLKKQPIVETDQPLHEIVMYQEELVKEKNAKERMKLANQKLEILMNQMERQVVGSAVGYFNKNKKQDTKEDWHKVIKIDLREYSQLFQKAKYLERSWLLNQALETKSEKMVVSDSEMTYEREQVRKIKDVSNPEEIFFMIDECEMIAKRVKIRERPFWGKPNVRIMKMDYENLMDKAAYFDLLQGENYLLEQIFQQKQVKSDQQKVVLNQEDV